MKHLFHDHAGEIVAVDSINDVEDAYRIAGLTIPSHIGDWDQIDDDEPTVAPSNDYVDDGLTAAQVASDFVIPTVVSSVHFRYKQ